MIERKSISLQFKEAGDDGAFEAVVATLGVVDAHNDIIMKGAVGREVVVPVLPAHDMRATPLGKARVFEEGDKLIARGSFNLRTTAGRDWYEALKFDFDNPPVVQEWSFGLRVLEADNRKQDGNTVRVIKRMEIFEVSPVLKGAGVDTQTVYVKAATPKHKTEVKDVVWDGPANERRLPSPMPRSLANAVYAWIDDEAGDEVRKTQAKFPHHFVDQDGKPGAASLRACITGIGILNGARGGASIPEKDRKAVYEHLAKHVRDAGLEPPELKSIDEIEKSGPRVSFLDQCKMARWEVEALLHVMRARMKMRAKEGRDVPPEMLDEYVKLQEARAALTGEAERLYAGYLAVEAKRKGYLTE